MGSGSIQLFGTLGGALILLSFGKSNVISDVLRYPVQLLFFFFCILSIFWAPNFVFSLRMLAKLLSPFIFLLIAHLMIVDNINTVTIEKATFIGLLILLFVALLNHFTGFLGDASTDEWRVKNILTAPFHSPAPFSFSMACGAMLSLANYISDRRKTYLLLFAIFSIAVFWAFTRISIVGLIVACSVLIFLLAKSTILKVLLPVLLCLGITVAFLNFDRLKERSFQNPSEASLSQLMKKPGAFAKNIHTSGRTKLWEKGLKRFFHQSPIIGAGLGATQGFYYEKHRGGAIHSEYLRLLCEVGITGIVLFILAMTQYLAMLLAVFRRSDSGNTFEEKFKRKYSGLAIASLIFYLITMATDNTIDYVMSLGLYTFLFIGFALNASKQHQRLNNPGMCQ